MLRLSIWWSRLVSRVPIPTISLNKAKSTNWPPLPIRIDSNCWERFSLQMLFKGLVDADFSFRWPLHTLTVVFCAVLISVVFALSIFYLGELLIVDVCINIFQLKRTYFYTWNFGMIDVCDCSFSKNSGRIWVFSLIRHKLIPFLISVILSVVTSM